MNRDELNSALWAARRDAGMMIHPRRWYLWHAEAGYQPQPLPTGTDDLARAIDFACAQYSPVRCQPGCRYFIRRSRYRWIGSDSQLPTGLFP